MTVPVEHSEPAREGPAASRLSALNATALARHHQLPTRLVLALFGALMMWMAGLRWASPAWFGAVVVSQLIDAWLWAPVRNPARKTPLTRGEWLRICASASAMTMIYSALPALMWFLWGASGKIFATVWLCGALLHVTMHMHHERRTFFAAAIPHAVYFFGLPLYSILTGAEPGRVGGVTALLAGLLYVGHLTAAFREYRAGSEALRRAREEALRRQEAAEQASVAKSAFLANMSHEIRTPMNGILGMAESLESPKLTAEQANKVRIIRESGDLLLSVLNDLLDFSKIEANRVEFETAPFRLCEIACRIGDLHGLRAKEKGLTLSVVCEGDRETSYLGDSHRIVQILHNLVGNAIKFTSSGGVRVRLVGDEDALGDSRVTIEVADTGIGLSQEQIDRIFEPFIQADTTTTRKFGGTGLGLSIVKGLVDAMGGTVEVSSQAGAGSRFTVRLPLQKSEVKNGDAPTSNAADEAVSQVSARKLKILIAEDNAVNRAVLEAFLKPRGHDLAFANDGLAVVEACRRGHFDLILMDISMPVIDGVEALRQIRLFERRRGEARATPAIAVSAHAMQQQIEEYLAAGFDGYVTKPVKADRLYAEINRVMSERAEEKSASSAA